MNDTPALPPPETPPDPVPPEPRRFTFLPILYLAGFIILAFAIIWVWRNPLPPPAPEVTAGDIGALRQQVQSLEQRVAALQQRPVAQAPDLRPLEARIAAVEQRAPKEAPDLRPIEDRIAALEQRMGSDRQSLPQLEQRLAALEQRKPPDLGPLEARIAALEQRPALPPEAATKADLASFSSRVDAIATRQDQLAAREQGLETNFANKLDGMDAQLAKFGRDLAVLTDFGNRLDASDKRLEAIDKRLATVEQEASKVTALADKAGRIGRIQAAQVALDTGQPLGELPGAPESLARFAKTRPPTEAALRLSFPAAARAAEAASKPSAEGKPFLDRVWLRAQDLLTVREGDRVIVGDPAAGILARARQALNAGDLAGAVAALDALQGPAAQAMADWKAQAQDLLDARAALAAMAART